MSESILPVPCRQGNTNETSAPGSVAISTPNPVTVKPRHSVRAIEGAYEVGVFLPGVKRDEVRVRLEENELTVEATRAEAIPHGWRTLHRETEPATYRLTLEVSVPVDAARVSARLEEGVLSLRLPLREEAKPRDIPVA